MGEKITSSGGQGSELLTCWMNKDACERRSTYALADAGADAPAGAPARKASSFARTE
jgi:hypothetical protein